MRLVISGRIFSPHSLDLMAACQASEDLVSAESTSFSANYVGASRSPSTLFNL